jgi:hypothetical protein
MPVIVVSPGWNATSVAVFFLQSLDRVAYVRIKSHAAGAEMGKGVFHVFPAYKKRGPTKPVQYHRRDGVFLLDVAGVMRAQGKAVGHHHHP